MASQKPTENNKVPGNSYTNKVFQQDIRVLLLFIGKHCDYKHQSEKKTIAQLPKKYGKPIDNMPIFLCSSCQCLFEYAAMRRYNCDRNPKPMCKECLRQCYHPVFRDKILQVMTFSHQHFAENIYMP